ncbi:MAG: hypothetical protein ACP5MD_05565 [Verrucomicrobiia bacterium]
MVNSRETNRSLEHRNTETQVCCAIIWRSYSWSLILTQCGGLTPAAKSAIIKARNVSTRKWQQGIAASQTQVIECSGKYYYDKHWI